MKLIAAIALLSDGNIPFAVYIPGWIEGKSATRIMTQENLTIRCRHEKWIKLHVTDASATTGIVLCGFYHLSHMNMQLREYVVEIGGKTLLSVCLKHMLETDHFHCSQGKVRGLASSAVSFQVNFPNLLYVSAPL